MSAFEVTKDQTTVFDKKKVEELHELDDWGSAWEECKRLGKKWGGRGAGGRATNRQTIQTQDVSVEGVTLIYLGNNLLDRTTVRFLQGHKYGLIGRNGVGKSTLMSRINTGTLPGFPPHLRVSLVSQELPVVPNDTMNTVEFVVHLNNDRNEVMQQIERIENGEFQDAEDYDAEEEAELLSTLYDAVEETGQITARAVRILTDLGFSEKRRGMPVAAMSGGWKMRCAIAAALTQQPNILLLDEPTNHLDLEGVEWLKSYIKSPAAADTTVVVVSHDKNFLDEVCTDIIRFHRQHLHYYPGNYTAFEIAYSDKESHNRSLQDTLDKQRKKLEDQVRKMQVTAAKSDSSTGMVASRKKKLLRHGAEKNEKGFRFRVQQDSYHGMSASRAGAHNEVALGYKTGESRNLCDWVEKEWSMALPNPVPLSTAGAYFQLRTATIGYALNGSPRPELPVDTIPAYVTPAGGMPVSGKGKKNINAVKVSASARAAIASAAVNTTAELENFKVIIKTITLDIAENSKIGIVGKNGCGKSTLLKIIDEFQSEKDIPETSPCLSAGSVFKANHLRVAYYQQHQQDSLPYAVSPLEYLTHVAAPMTSLNHNEQTLRAHLGSFGIGGELVSRPIGTLSGGQKCRLVLAELTVSRPHLLLLDEPTNNLDLDAVKALTAALKNFAGAYIITSHDMAFVNDTADDFYHMVSGVINRLENGVSDYIQFVKATVAKSRNAK